MILYIENPKDSTRKLIELINEYSKVAEYKINTQKSLAFLYTNNEKIEKEIKETISSTIATKRIKYLRINLPKETNDLYMLLLLLSHQSCPTLCDPIDPACPWDSPGKNTGVGCHYLLQCMKVKSESEVA